MKKTVTVIVKAVVIISAAVTLILRLYTYKMFETLDEATRNGIDTIAYISGAVVLVSGIAWVLIEKRGGNNEAKTYEYTLPDFDGGSDESAEETEE